MSKAVVTAIACGLALANAEWQQPGSPASDPRSASVRLFVPTAPVAVRAAGHTVLVYELHVVNDGPLPLRLNRLEVRAVSASDSTTVATYDRRQIERDLKLLAPRGAPHPNALTTGVRAILYVWLSLDSTAEVPRELTHRVVFASGDTARGGSTRVRADSGLVLAPPVGAGDWWIALGASNASEHRREVLRVGDDTVPHLAQRFAIDWVQMDARGEYARDHVGKKNAEWFGYGATVNAVADARVVAVIDTLPDNTPGEHSRAVAITPGTVLGNYVLLDLGAGDREMHRFALYGHLQPGTARVRVGDLVRRGQPLGAIGNSGNSDGPHLHFQITEAADPATAPLRGEGIPFVLSAFSVVSHDPEQVKRSALLSTIGAHRDALPVDGDVIRVDIPSR